MAGPSLSAEARYHAEPLSVERKPENTREEGQERVRSFSAQERAAMKERAAELRTEGKKSANRADGLQAVLDRIAQMAPEDRAVAERAHAAVTTTAPELSPKDVGRDARPRERGRQGRRLLPGGHVQVSVLDPRLPGRREDGIRQRPLRGRNAVACARSRLRSSATYAYPRQMPSESDTGRIHPGAAWNCL